MKYFLKFTKCNKSYDNVSVPENLDVAPTLSPMRDVIVPEGNAAQFRTQVSGQPSPSVQWFREGTLIPETPDFKVSLNIVYLYNSNNVIIINKYIM